MADQLTCSAQFGVSEAKFPHVLLVPAAVRREELVPALRSEGVDGARPEEDTSYSAGDRPADTNMMAVRPQTCQGEGGQGGGD